METIGREWTVLTWNIQGAKPTDLARLAAVIDAQTPDVVVLQEVRRPQAAALAERLAMTHCWAAKHNPYRPFFTNRTEGSAIFTTHDLSEPGDMRVSSAKSRRHYTRRIVQWATVTRSDASGYRIYNAHLSPFDRSAQRLEEAQRIAALVAEHGDSPPAIVAGDLNDENEPAIIAALPGIEALSAPRTNPAGSPTQALDHVVIPASASGVSVSAPVGGNDWAELSDHLPVTVRFTLEWVAGGFTG